MTTIDFMLYHRGELLSCLATLRDLRLDLPEGLVARVERADGERLDYVAENSAYETVDEICRVAASLVHQPWPGALVLLWPAWAPPLIERPRDSRQALVLSALYWSDAQRARHEEDHPTGRSDAQAYREEAPLPWR